jgi:hypothetical protein
MDVLEGDGIRIRPLRGGDAERFAAGTRDPEVRDHSGLPAERTPESARAHADADNPASHAVLERNGFEREGLMRGYGRRGDRRVDAVVFGRLGR